MAAADKFTRLTPELYGYAVAHGHNRDPLLAQLAAETAELGAISMMQIAAEQGTFMGILARAIGAFTGYSALCVARALPADGRLLCCDINEHWTAIARRYWEKAGVAGKITLKLGPAIDTLRALPSSTVFDLAFIDADKPNYRTYYEEVLERLRADGLILIDNVLWNGQVLDASDNSENTRAIREVNDFIAKDDRVEAVMLPIADGLTIARKK